ncbi:hypothetical protein L226DRAFT_73062 [Lentinus tigrinus ALCF2SS1-7]|uniref:Uncharacterized protein n=1 Tax=Lentinus tigrinus ALCF2SS1-6 TaxID=1328759 RepID=A0A5C2SDQ3_9APHY|nr:hypothetical protein L227DRAFT_43165 [Lentinus tigrinus ALCF2SS1-6]RPD74395.1 hypothetical protein L226DRAFT_73062 [Lentinus tigrinus ALCF2SS1-7]
MSYCRLASAHSFLHLSFGSCSSFIPFPIHPSPTSYPPPCRPLSTPVMPNPAVSVATDGANGRRAAILVVRLRAVAQDISSCVESVVLLCSSIECVGGGEAGMVCSCSGAGGTA